MAFTRLMTTSAGGAVRISAGLVLLVVGSLFGEAWWIMAVLGVLGVLVIVTSTRGDRPGCRCRG
jgi:hypothetical protein